MSHTSKTPSAAAASDNEITLAAPATKGPTKTADVVTLLQREQGATLAEMVEATSWQPHTTRAMLTGLRKKGHAIERSKRENIACYYLPVVDA